MEPPHEPGRGRRALEAAAFVALWMALGWLIRPAFKVRPEAPLESPFALAYLMLGIPLTALFQVVIRRQPLRAMWVRDAPPPRLGRWGWLIAAGLMAIPALGTLAELGEGKWASAAFAAGALLGAIGAAYAIRQLRRPALRLMALCLAVVAAIDVAVSALLHRVFPELPPFLAPTPGRMLLVLVATANYLPTCFVYEEVTFRGTLDAHLHPPSKGRSTGSPAAPHDPELDARTRHPGGGRGWASALYVSALWGLWHLPVAYPGPDSLPELVGGFLLVHVAVGVPLSFFWRRTGNLTVPALAHGFIDALRDALNVV
jgi:hypothetical protein